MAGPDRMRFRKLVEPHLDALFRAAYRLTRHGADAEDLVQETCLRAYARISELDAAGQVKAWLLRVMHNLFVDGIRRARNSPVDAVGDLARLTAATACPAPTPEESLASGQRLARIERAYRRLDREQQALLALRAEGYSLAEISGITHIAMDALNMRLYRARQCLTRCLQEEEEASRPSPKEATK